MSQGEGKALNQWTVRLKAVECGYIKENEGLKKGISLLDKGGGSLSSKERVLIDVTGGGSYVGEPLTVVCHKRGWGALTDSDEVPMWEGRIAELRLGGRLTL